MNCLLDTNIVSELRKGRRCDPGVSAWFQTLAPASAFLSVLVLGEIRRGIESVQRRDPSAAAALESWLEGLVRCYSERILPVDLRVAEMWGRINVPDPLPAVDGLIAATARVHDMVLVTRNEVDMARTGVRLLNPFSPAPSVR